MATTRLVTLEDIANLPDGYRYDVIRGELYTMPPAGEGHGSYANEIAWRVSAYADRHGLGRGYVAETGFRLADSPLTLVCTDFAFVRQARLVDGGQRVAFSDTVPDLVVEVVSPSDFPKLVHDKIQAYMRAGVSLLWVVDSRQRTITVHRPEREARVLSTVDELDGEDVLPGFRLPVATIFA